MKNFRLDIIAHFPGWTRFSAAVSRPDDPCEREENHCGSGKYCLPVSGAAGNFYEASRPKGTPRFCR